MRGLFLTLALLLPVAAAAGAPAEVFTCAGKIEGQGGMFCHGTATMNDHALVIDSHKVFSTDRQSYPFAKIASFHTHTGLFHSYNEITIKDNKGTVTIVSPIADCIAISHQVANKVIAASYEDRPVGAP